MIVLRNYFSLPLFVYFLQIDGSCTGILSSVFIVFVLKLLKKSENIKEVKEKMHLSKKHQFELLSVKYTHI